ncbi:fatty acid synthase alpha subunit Lsd1, partial [Coemansia sp. BCRC 34301]
MTQPFVTVRQGAVLVELRPPDTHALSVQELARTFNARPAETLSAIELHAAFIQHCVDCGSSEAALAVFNDFCQTFGTDARNIHAIIQAQGLDEAAARRVLKGYFSAWPLVNSSSGTPFTWPATPTPALFTAAKSVGLVAMFGGQRGTSTYLDEAEWLLDIYRPLLSDFVFRMSAFLHHESQDSRINFVYSKGLDVFCWLTTANTMPDEQYLLSIPVCLPLVGLIQLMHVMVTYKTLGVSPGKLVNNFKVAIGHSQGIGIAAAFSALTDEQSFYDVGKKILGIHLLAGAFPQLQYPCHRLNSSAPKNAHHISDGEPRPMVSVQGVAKPVLERLIAKFNDRQTSSAGHAFLAVVNTVDQFIIACRVLSAVDLVSFLRS